MVKFGRDIVHSSFSGHCLLCRDSYKGSSEICSDCYEEIQPLSAHHCRYCLSQLALSTETICANCELNRPAWDHIYCHAQYNLRVQSIILGLKEHRQLSFAKLMAQDLSAYTQDIDMLIPMPCHWTRRMTRGFNQTEIIADYMSELTGIKARKDLVLRHRRTRKQIEFYNFVDRASNVQSAFMLNKASKSDIYNKHIAIIDDVITSGASAEALSRTLKAAYPKKISIISYARAGISD